MKKLLLLLLVLIVVVIGAAAWFLLGPATGFSEKQKALYIRSNAATKEAVLDSINTTHITNHSTLFEWLANKMDLWQNIKPGKYEIPRGSSVLSIVRKLRNGQQSPVNLVITKLRTKEDFAHLVGRHFECDSEQMMAFLNSSDSLKPFDVDTLEAMTLILPDNYTFFWNTTPS